MSRLHDKLRRDRSAPAPTAPRRQFEDTVLKSAAIAATQPGAPPSNTTVVFQQYHPLIAKEVNRWSASGLPKLVLEAEAKRLVAHAVHTYDPKRNTTLGTHLQTHLKQLDAFVNTYAPDVRMPVEKVHLGNRALAAITALRLELGREPTTAEVSERSGLTKHTLSGLHKWQTNLYSKVDAGGFAQPVRDDISHHGIMLDFIHHDLNAQQKFVFEHTTGHKGKPLLSMGDIATQLNVSPSRVSMLKNEIADKARGYNHAIGSLMK